VVNFTRVLALKEVADFIQIGLVSYQTGRRFTGLRAIRGGSVSVDGGSVRVNIGGVVTELSIEDAAADAGVAGAAGRGRRPTVAPALRPGVVAEAGVEEATRFGTGLATAVREISPGERALALVSAPAAGLVIGRALTAPRVEQVQAASVGPDPDASPFTLREFITYQEAGKDRRQQAAIGAEASLAAQRAAATERLSALDAQIERERIAAQRDISRERIVASLELQREQIAAQFGLQRERLDVQLEAQGREHAADERQLTLRFGLQEQVNEAERKWKSTEAVADRTWREDQKRKDEDWGSYWKNAAADRAVARSLEAAAGITRILRDANASQSAVVNFAQAFGRGGS